MNWKAPSAVIFPYNIRNEKLGTFSNVICKLRGWWSLLGVRKNDSGNSKNDSDNANENDNENVNVTKTIIMMVMIMATITKTIMIKIMIITTRTRTIMITIMIKIMITIMIMIIMTIMIMTTITKTIMITITKTIMITEIPLHVPIFARTLNSLHRPPTKPPATRSALQNSQCVYTRGAF